MYKTHGMSGTKFYNTWCGIKARCFNENETCFHNYGGRGITMCDRWGKFENFKEDMYPSFLEHLEKHGPRETTIERIDNDGIYSPENCIWATRSVQVNNTRQVKHFPYKGEMLSLAEISKLEGISYKTLRSRVNVYGWSLEDALSKDIGVKKNTKLYMHKGKEKNIKAIALEEGINMQTLYKRVKKMSLEEAINIPDRKKEFKATNLKTGETYIYKSKVEFARDFGIKKPKILPVLKGQRQSSHGFKFEYI